MRPGVELLKVLYDKRFSGLEVSGEPFGEGDEGAVVIALLLNIEDAVSRKVDKGLPQSQKFLGGAVWCDSR